MNLGQHIEMLAGGPGSGRHPGITNVKQAMALTNARRAKQAALKSGATKEEAQKAHDRAYEETLIRLTTAKTVA